MTGNDRCSRRRFLRGAAVSATVGAAALAGCPTGGAPLSDAGDDPTSVTEWLPERAAFGVDLPVRYDVTRVKRLRERRFDMEPPVFAALSPQARFPGHVLVRPSEVAEVADVVVDDNFCGVVTGSFDRSTALRLVESLGATEVGTYRETTLARRVEEGEFGEVEFWALGDGVAVYAPAEETIAARGLVERFVDAARDGEQFHDAERGPAAVLRSMDSGERYTASMYGDDGGRVQPDFEGEQFRVSTTEGRDDALVRTVRWRFEDSVPETAVRDLLNSDDRENPLQGYEDVSLSVEGDEAVATGELVDPEPRR